MPDSSLVPLLLLAMDAVARGAFTEAEGLVDQALEQIRLLSPDGDVEEDSIEELAPTTA